MALSAGTAAWLATADRFVLGTDQPQLLGLRYTDPALVRAAIGIAPGATPNVFLLRTGDMARAVASLPPVSSAVVDAALPDRLTVLVTERSPVFVLVEDRPYLVDADGVLLAELGAGQMPAGMPVVTDQRAAGAAWAVGGKVDPIDLAAILPLGALTPSMVDSQATGLRLAIDPSDGFVLTADPQGWQAIFGQYTPNLRPTDQIPRQVQCLRSLLANGETDIARIYLAPLEDRCGTYLPRSMPSPSPSASATM